MKTKPMKGKKVKIVIENYTYYGHIEQCFDDGTYTIIYEKGKGGARLSQDKFEVIES